jgi:hypothetical protein
MENAQWRSGGATTTPATGAVLTGYHPLDERIPPSLLLDIGAELQDAAGISTAASASAGDGLTKNLQQPPESAVRNFDTPRPFVFCRRSFGTIDLLLRIGMLRKELVWPFYLFFFENL